MALCKVHAEEWNRWLDYRPVQQIQLVVVGGNSPRAVAEARRLRAEETHRTIRTQQKLIADVCRRDHQPQED